MEGWLRMMIMLAQVGYKNVELLEKACPVQKRIFESLETMSGKSLALYLVNVHESVISYTELKNQHWIISDYNVHTDKLSHEQHKTLLSVSNVK